MVLDFTFLVIHLATVCIVGQLVQPFVQLACTFFNLRVLVTNKPLVYKPVSRFLY